MSLTSIDRLDVRAKVWVFGSSAPLDAENEAFARRELQSFMTEWTAHGADLPGAFDVLENRFVVVAADDAANPGGCSVDRLFRLMTAIGSKFGVSLLDSDRVFFRKRDGSIDSATREEFRGLAARGEVGPETIVFDTTIAELHQLRGGNWEKKAKDSWHKRLLTQAN